MAGIGLLRSRERVGHAAFAVSAAGCIGGSPLFKRLENTGFVMAVPKRKTTPSKRGMRRSHDSLRVEAFQECPNCGELKRPHNMCDKCGYYNGREVVAIGA
jgi:large subunit ribosomal protein L32